MTKVWCVLAVSPQCDAIVSRNLSRPDPIMGRPEFEVFYVHERFERQAHGRVVIDSRPRFPGYIFVRCDLSTPWWRLVGRMWGVRHFLPMHHERPVAIPDHWIEKILSAYPTGEIDLVSMKKEVLKHQVGQNLKIERGPFAGFGGQCIRADSEAAVIMVEIFGRSNLTTIRQIDLDPMWMENIPTQDVVDANEKLREKRITTSRVKRCSHSGGLRSECGSHSHTKRQRGAS